jgi:hypothetical protein
VDGWALPALSGGACPLAAGDEVAPSPAAARWSDRTGPIDAGSVGAVVWVEASAGASGAG